MSKMEHLNARVTKLLSEAVQEVLEVVKETVSEYQEKTARTQRENESLKRRLVELEDKITKESTRVLPISGKLPEEKQDAQFFEQHVSLTQRHSSGVTLTDPKAISSNNSDHSVKQECKEQENHIKTKSTAEHESPQTSTDHYKAQAEKRVHVIEETMTLQPPHSANMDTLHSSNPLRVNLTAIKREEETANCTASDPSPLQEPYSGCVDLSCNSSRHNTAQAPRPQVRAEPYGLVFAHSKHIIPRRHVFAKTNRAAFDMTNIKREHMGEHSHLCVICGKTFSRVGNLRIHQRCHTGEKPYGCMQCGRCFTQSGDLKKHKRVHTGEKPYYCNQCGKSFSRGENLKRHQKIHIGQRLQLQQAWKEQQL